MKKPVFYDPEGKRKKYFFAFSSIIISFVLACFAGLIGEIFVQEKLPVQEFEYGTTGDLYQVDDLGVKHIKAVNEKYLALTFDDGPDKRNTPQILKILEETGTKATFFVVGNLVNSEPKLTEEIAKKGHEIGNHTFTHVNSEKISDTYLRLEIESTQELIESRLGFKTKIFRAPYSDDRDPEQLSQIEPLKVATEMGFVNAGMKIDPKDWKAGSSEDIVAKINEKVAEGKGNVILLHDGGEDRQNTIDALPIVIEVLTSQGYEFVTVSELIGMKEPYVYASQDGVANILNRSNLFVFNFIRYLGVSIKALAMISVVIGILRFLLVTIFALVDKRSKLKKKLDLKYLPKVAAIVPAFNEEKVVVRTIESLLSSDYPNLEVVVVDDGSKDKTYEVVNTFFKGNKRVKNYRTENGGKSSAINFGISKTRASIVIILDADTIIKKDAIKKLAVYFKDKRVAAVAGNAKVGNRVNFLTKIQAIEYITSQNLERRAFNVFNSIRVVAGAIGAWRRTAIIAAGGFTHDTLAEDTDMTLKLLRLGHRVEYEPDAIAYTEAPEKIETFMKQRFRWMHGTFQAIWKHMDTVFKPSYGTMGLIAIPDVLIFQVFFPLFAPLMDFFLVANIYISVVNILQHPTTHSTLALEQALLYYIAFMVFDYISSGLSFAMEKRENKNLLFYLFLQRFLYRQLLYISAIRSTLTAITGERVGWGKFERTASVSQNLSLEYSKA